MGIKENVEEVLQAISDASSTKITLVAVSKGRTTKEILEAYQLGLRDFGESRIQEALVKIPELPRDIRWHFIGHLQKNKIHHALAFHLIHSVDTPELAKALSEVSVKAEKQTAILLQVNTSGEKSKRGLSPELWKDHFLSLLSLPGVLIEGLMTMAPLTDNEEVIRSTFRKLKELQGDLQKIAEGRVELSQLSMGMSHDFKIAIEEGATLLRIGSAIFQTDSEKIV